MRRFRKLILRLFCSGLFRTARQRLFLHRAARHPARGPAPRPGTRVLVLGVYLANRKHSAVHLSERLASDGNLEVVQRWAALGGSTTDPRLLDATALFPLTPEPKLSLIDKLLQPGDLDAFDHIVVCDDDIYVPRHFLAAFIGYQQAFDFALAQPARAWHSFYDHSFVLRRPWLKARETRFVECGPLVSFRRDAARLLLPFGDGDQMWGHDFVWPEVLERHGLSMGIVDAISIDHSLRAQAASYDSGKEDAAMNAYLARTPHLSKNEAFTVRKRHTVLASRRPARG
jgi:hypothetical protein